MTPLRQVFGYYVYAMYGLDYEPRNVKEKWLLQTVYWGTILLVAFFFWEYVKAK